MKSQKHWDNFFIEMAQLVATNSYDTRKVGCVIVKGDAILAYSYNGTPRGWSNITRDTENEPVDHILHAEAHAIAKCARAGVSTAYSTLYCTYEPCIDCAKLIASSGIVRVIYEDSSNCQDGINHLIRAGVSVRCIYDDKAMNNPHCSLADPVWLEHHTGLTR